jgi:hypothetical protein
MLKKKFSERNSPIQSPSSDIQSSSFTHMGGKSSTNQQAIRIHPSTSTLQTSLKQSPYTHYNKNSIQYSPTK